MKNHMTDAGNVFNFPSSESTCLNCGNSVSTALETQSFPYGVGEQSVTLEATIPVRYCQRCDIAFTDDEAENLRHEAVCRHLGVMTPREVAAVRKHLMMSVTDLARLTGIGPASLRRWESGALVQNVANDQLLFLLTFAENVERLKARDRKAPLREGHRQSGPRASSFRSIKPDARMRDEAANFKLCAI